MSESAYFLYRCNHINHQLHPPIMPGPIRPIHPQAQPQPTFIPNPTAAPQTSIIVRVICPLQLICLRYLRKTGNKPKTSIEKSTRENTWVVVGRRDANTTEAMIAALVESEAGNLIARINQQHPAIHSSRSRILHNHPTPIIKAQTIGQK